MASREVAGVPGRERQPVVSPAAERAWLVAAQRWRRRSAFDAGPTLPTPPAARWSGSAPMKDLPTPRPADEATGVKRLAFPFLLFPVVCRCWGARIHPAPRQTY